MPAAFPRDFGRYRLTGLLGAGGMAEVYRAVPVEAREGFPAEVALKRISRDFGEENDLDRIVLDEARIWRRLDHPNVVRLLDFGEHEENWYFAMELVEGFSLAEILKRVDALPVPEALYVVVSIARALGHAHAATDDAGNPLEIVHRDVKPANILVAPDGSVKLTDFGIARAKGRLSHTRIGEVKGSVYFLSPEQYHGKSVDGRADLFSLGAVLHVMLTGSALIDLPEVELLAALEDRRVPEPPQHLAPALRGILQALTAADPADRAADADAVVAKVRAFLPEDSLEEGRQQLGFRVQALRAGGASPISSLVEQSGQWRSARRSVMLTDAGDDDDKTRISDQATTGASATAVTRARGDITATGHTLRSSDGPVPVDETGASRERSVTVHVRVERRRDPNDTSPSPEAASVTAAPDGAPVTGEIETTTGPGASAPAAPAAPAFPFELERTRVSRSRSSNSGGSAAASASVSASVARLPTVDEIPEMRSRSADMRREWLIVAVAGIAVIVVALLLAGPVYRLVAG